MNLVSFSTKFLLILTLLSGFALPSTASNVQFSEEIKPAFLRWKTVKIPIALSYSLVRQNPNIIAGSDAENAVRRSLETWERAANIEFETTWTELQTVNPAGNSGDGVNLMTIAQTAENLSMFASETKDVSARTRVYFNRRGVINEADIVLNPYQQFSTDGTIGTFDLEATVTHEIGHLLGLEHSLIISSTMYAQQGKNGVYNLPGFGARTLAEDDLAAVRTLYGAKDSEECCGRIQGRLLQANGKPSRDTRLWAEEAKSGRVVAGAATNADGTFKADGLLPGVYRVYAQSASDKKNLSSAEEVGEIEIKKGKTANVFKKLKSISKDFALQYIGLNGQLSELSVPLSRGKSYTVYVGGKNLAVEDCSIVFNSPYFTVTPNSITAQDFGSEVSVLSFEVNVKSEIPFGQYSFALRKTSGSIQYFVGGLTVEKFPNSAADFLSNVDN